MRKSNPNRGNMVTIEMFGNVEMLDFYFYAIFLKSTAGFRRTANFRGIHEPYL